MTKYTILAVTLMVFLGLSGVGGAHSAVSQAASAGPRCGTSHHRVPVKHVVWIFLENTDYSAVIGNRQAPYVNRLARNCRLATNYHGLANPSLPNYMGATSGQTQFHSDCQPLACRSKLTSIFNTVGSWRDYQGGMKRPCQKVAGTAYEPEHNPAVYYENCHRSAARETCRCARSSSEQHGSSSSPPTRMFRTSWPRVATPGSRAGCRNISSTGGHTVMARPLCSLPGTSRTNPVTILR